MPFLTGDGGWRLGKPIDEVKVDVSLVFLTTLDLETVEAATDLEERSFFNEAREEACLLAAALAK